MDNHSYIYALAAMALWGLAPVLGKLGLVNLEPLAALTVRSATITAILVAFMVLSGRWNSVAGIAAKDWLFMALEGLCAALFGQLAYYYALKHGEVSKVSPLVSAFPLVALVMAAAILGEKITAWKIAGAICIVLGVIMLKY